MPAATVDPMRPEPYRIDKVRRETHDTFTMHLSPADGGPSLAIEPGQFNMLYVFGTGEVPISVSGDTSQQKALTHTVRAVGTVTRAMSALKAGATLGIRGPFGNVWPLAEATQQDVLVIAGGLGLAPLRPALYQLLARREQFRRVVLLYGARTPEDILFRAELERWRGKFDLDVQVTVDRATPGWRGHVGVVTTLFAHASFDPASAVALICGPEVMIRFAAMELLGRGMPQERLYLSMERNMKCAIGFCGHCQWGAPFICRDGPVFRYDRIAALFTTPEG